MSQRSTATRPHPKSASFGALLLLAGVAVAPSRAAQGEPAERASADAASANRAAVQTTAPGRGAAFGVAPLDAEAVELLALARGVVLWGEVLEADDAGVTVRRLDQGGTVRLDWQQLAESTERELRLRHGLLDLTSDELFVTAQRVPLVDGGEAIGLLVDRTADTLHLKTAGKLLQLPLSRVAAGMTNVEVPAREIYTRDELYQQRANAVAGELLAGGERAAAAHGDLALFCEQLLDYRRALEHWRAAAELGLARPDLTARLAQAERKSAVQEQVDLLDGADRLRARGQYPAALLELDAFLTRFPQSPLLEDRAKLASRVAKDQKRALERLVPQRWHHWVGRLIREAAQDKALEEARQWLAEGFADEVAVKVAEDARELASDVGVEDVRSLWAARPKGRLHSATYGYATFLLGADEARKGLEPEEEEGEATSEKDAQRKELEERIKRYFENQDQAKRAQEGGADGPDPEAVWKSLGGNVRAQWMLAWYAEHGGDMQVERIGFSACRECGGAGALEVTFTGNSATPSGSRLVPCPICYQVGVVRRVVYR